MSCSSIAHYVNFDNPILQNKDKKIILSSSFFKIGPGLYGVSFQTKPDTVFSQRVCANFVECVGLCVGCVRSKKIAPLEMDVTHTQLNTLVSTI